MKRLSPRPIIDSSTLRHYGVLVVMLGVGTALRFWQLEAKPLWLDEVITALFSLGRSYQDVPLNNFFSFTDLDRVFTLQPDATCADIAQRVMTESTHPPLYFCVSHAWLTWLQPGVNSWVWALRSLPALLGVLNILAIYVLNRVAFSPAAGLLGAALMAVSPFAVYLSQEARHYTLPMLLIVLALVGLVQMQQDLDRQQRLRPWVWLGWIGINGLGLYVHYFFVLALLAQLVAITGWMLWQRQRIGWRSWGWLSLATAGIGIIYLPWVPVILSHSSRPESDWLTLSDPGWLERIAPLYQLVMGWVLMVIALPVEAQPLAIALPAALLMAAFALWLAPKVYQGVQQRWQTASDQPAIVLLLGFTGCIVLEFLAIVYILNKDITVVPRYNFVYYPGVCALLAAALTVRSKSTLSLPQLRAFRSAPLALLLVGMCSSLMVGYGLAFQKAYYPDQVARDLYFDRARPTAVVMSYESLQDVALGLSFALELQQQYTNELEAPFRFAFLHRQAGFQPVWRQLARLPQPLSPPLNLWVIAPGLRRKEYPDRLRLSPPNYQRAPKAVCAIDQAYYRRIGIPYQLYRCHSRTNTSARSQ